MGLGFVMLRCRDCGVVTSVPRTIWKQFMQCDIGDCKGEWVRQPKLEQQIEANSVGEKQAALPVRQEETPNTVGDRLAELERENERLRRIIIAQAEMIVQQSEFAHYLLGRKTEKGERL